MGIVQDSLLGTMLMTERDTFLTKDQAMQLLMWMPETMGELKLPTPSLIRPEALWTGKQIFSMLIPRVNLARKKNYCCPKD
jgi:DNA-directed RNA polymerase II subunit RPB1